MYVGWVAWIMRERGAKMCAHVCMNATKRAHACTDVGEARIEVFLFSLSLKDL